jgi:hypothetical protein
VVVTYECKWCDWGEKKIELMVRINGLSGTVFRVGPPKLQVEPPKFKASLPGLSVGSVVCHFDFLIMCNTLYIS